MRKTQPLPNKESHIARQDVAPSAVGAIETFKFTSAKKGMDLATQWNSTRADRASYSRDVISEGKELGRYIVSKRLAARGKK